MPRRKRSRECKKCTSCYTVNQAAERGHPACLKKLHTTTDSASTETVELACLSRSTKSVEFLLNKGYSYNETAVQNAIVVNDRQMFELLLTHTPNKFGSYDRDRFIEHACTHDALECLEVLAGFVTISQSFAETLLTKAVGNPRCLKYLLERFSLPINITLVEQTFEAQPNDNKLLSCLQTFAKYTDMTENDDWLGIQFQAARRKTSKCLRFLRDNNKGRNSPIVVLMEGAAIGNSLENMKYLYTLSPKEVWVTPPWCHGVLNLSSDPECVMYAVRHGCPVDTSGALHVLSKFKLRLPPLSLVLETVEVFLEHISDDACGISISFNDVVKRYATFRDDVNMRDDLIRFPNLRRHLMTKRLTLSEPALLRDLDAAVQHMETVRSTIEDVTNVEQDVVKYEIMKFL